jgi:pimeloyl-ACP methyl ester carboxylesterase
MAQTTVRAADTTALAVEEAGEGTPIVLLHGLTATRRYVVMGSRALERAGHRVVRYDARGHGQSTPAPDPADYDYSDLTGDLGRVLDALAIERAVLAGASMGAHTILRFALEHPARVAGLGVITPAYDPERHDDPARLARWDALADGFERGGVEGFVTAYGERTPAPQWRDTVFKVLSQRLAAHAHPEGVVAALRVVPRARPFRELDALSAIGVPTVVIASEDAADPGHPLAVGEAYASAIPGARLVRDTPGRSPIAWQGGQVSKVLATLTAKARAS